MVPAREDIYMNAEHPYDPPPLWVQGQALPLPLETFPPACPAREQGLLVEIYWLPPLWVQGHALPLFSLPGGQSGNPLSPHYADLLPFWLEGRGVPIPWT